MIQSMYVRVTIAVGVVGEGSAEFWVGVGVRRGSLIGPLLFTVVLKALSGRFGRGLKWELFCADDLVLLAASGEILIEKINTWKEGLESGGLGVSVGRSGVM